MRRRGFLGALWTGIAASFIAPVAIASEPVISNDVEKEVEELMAKLRHGQPTQSMRGNTKYITYVDEVGWFEKTVE